MAASTIAYLAEGKLHVRRPGTVPRVVESAFGKSLRERAAQIHHRHSWKYEGRGAQFMGGRGMGASSDPNQFRIAVSGVCPAQEPGGFLYSLETDDVSGIFAVAADGVEQRLFHTADFRVRQIALSPDGQTVAASVAHGPTGANLALIGIEGNDFFEATEGDSFDLAPSWCAGAGRRLVFQSAGVARNAAGHFTGVGPFAVQELDLDSGALTTLAEGGGEDFLAPRMDAAGTLYAIRRPYEAMDRKLHPGRAFVNALLAPFRLSHAVYQYFNFFSMRYTGKPLADGRGTVARHRDPREIAIGMNLARAARLEQGEGDSETGRVPSSWQLVRRTTEGVESVLGSGVLAFDVAANGDVAYSNGSAIYFVEQGTGKAEKLLSAKMIDQVAVLGAS